MASSKYYAYYIRGRQLAIVQHDYTLGSGQTLSQPGLNSVGARGYVLCKSPTEAIADGIEVEYAYSPRYFIETTNDVDQNITQYQSTDGKLSIADNSSAYINYATTYALAADKYIVLKKAGRFNGLHKIHSLTNNTGTNNKIILTTKYSGSESAWTDFEETPELYYAVDVLGDESDEIDLPEYLAKALVYYVRAKVAEDRGELEQKEYNMREFKRLLERNESSKIWGARRIGTDETAIK